MKDFLVFIVLDCLNDDTDFMIDQSRSKISALNGRGLGNEIAMRRLSSNCSREWYRQQRHENAAI